MKKIFHLISSVQLGGAENVAIQVCKNKPIELDYLKPSIVEVYQTSSVYAQQKRDELINSGISIISLSSFSKRIGLFIAPFSLFILLVTQKPDIVHSHTDIPDFVLSTALRLLKICRQHKPLIVRTIHNVELWPTHPVIGKYTESSFNEDSIIAVSKAALKAYQDKRVLFQLAVSPGEVIYNGCKTEKKEKLSEISLNNNEINIAFCGRFVPQKGVDFLIECIANHQKELQQIHFYFIGSGEYENRIVQLAQQFNNISNFPAINQISSKLSAFDYILVPSRFEGLGIISLESSFARVPVIAAKAPGLIETLPDDWDLFFEVDNEKELLNILRKIINGEYDKAALGDKAFAFVREKFSEKRMIDKYYHTYGDIL